MAVQSIEFDVPFVVRLNPHYADVLPKHMIWARGLLPSPGAEQKYLNWETPELSAFWFPFLGPEELLYAMNSFGWMVLFDGQFDQELGLDISGARKIVAHFQGLLSGQEAPNGPASSAFAEIWAEQYAGMSNDYKTRAGENWNNFFQSVLYETENRASRRIPSVNDYLRIRYTTGYMPVLYDFTERLYRIELPPDVKSSVAFRDLYTSYVWAHNLMEDLLSYQREEYQEDPHNIVFVLERENKLSREQAIAEAIHRTRSYFHSFVLAEAALPACLDELKTPISARQDIYTLTDSFRASFAGGYYWCRKSTRYQNGAANRAEQSGFLGNILPVLQ
jgi:hypothetical protein